MVVLKERHFKNCIFNQQLKHSQYSSMYPLIKVAIIKIPAIITIVKKLDSKNTYREQTFIFPRQLKQFRLLPIAMLTLD